MDDEKSFPVDWDNISVSEMGISNATRALTCSDQLTEGQCVNTRRKTDFSDSQFFESLPTEAIVKKFDADHSLQPTSFADASFVSQSRGSTTRDETIGQYFMKMSRIPSDLALDSEVSSTFKTPGFPVTSSSNTKKDERKRYSLTTITEGIRINAEQSQNETLRGYFSGTPSNGLSSEEVLNKVMEFCRNEVEKKKRISAATDHVDCGKGDDKVSPRHDLEQLQYNEDTFLRGNGIAEVSSIETFCSTIIPPHQSTPKKKSRSRYSLENLSKIPKGSTSSIAELLKNMDKLNEQSPSKESNVETTQSLNRDELCNKTIYSNQNSEMTVDGAPDAKLPQDRSQVPGSSVAHPNVCSDPIIAASGTVSNDNLEALHPKHGRPNSSPTFMLPKIRNENCTSLPDKLNSAIIDSDHNSFRSRYPSDLRGKNTLQSEEDGRASSRASSVISIGKSSVNGIQPYAKETISLRNIQQGERPFEIHINLQCPCRNDHHRSCCCEGGTLHSGHSLDHQIQQQHNIQSQPFQQILVPAPGGISSIPIHQPYQYHLLQVPITTQQPMLIQNQAQPVKDMNQRQ